MYRWFYRHCSVWTGIRQQAKRRTCTKVAIEGHGLTSFDCCPAAILLEEHKDRSSISYSGVIKKNTAEVVAREPGYKNPSTSPESAAIRKDF
jgi:hypothetical protein